MSDKQNLFETTRQIWNQTSAPARIAIVATLVVSIGVIAGVGYWSAQPHYVVLASNLDPGTASEVKSQLDENGIANQINFGGSAIMVDQQEYGAARLLIGDVVESSQLQANPLDSSLISDPGTRDHRITRDLELRLSRTLTEFKSIESAHVHLGLPDPQPFVRDRKEKTASVVIQLRPNTTFSRALTRTIATTIANGVEGLDASHVSISDTAGRTWTMDGSELNGAVSSQLEYQQQIERDLANKAESMLELMLGPGRAVVRITADIDFTHSTIQQDSYDPDSKVPESEEIESTTGTRENVLAAGIAGTGSNLGGAPAVSGNSARDVVMTTERRDVTYINSKTTETTTRQPGVLRRLTVAAMVQLEDGGDVDSASGAVAGAENGLAAGAPVSKEQVEAIIRQAVGFDAARNDEIEVLVTSLATPVTPESVVEQPSPWLTWLPLIRAASLGVAALVALLLGLLTLRQFRAVKSSADSSQSISPRRARQVSDLVALARNNPELLTRIMSAWGDDADERKTAEPESTRSRTAA